MALIEPTGTTKSLEMARTFAGSALGLTELLGRTKSPTGYLRSGRDAMKRTAIVICEPMPTLDRTPAWYSSPILKMKEALIKAGMTKVEVVSVIPIPFKYMATIRYEDNQ